VEAHTPCSRRLRAGAAERVGTCGRSRRRPYHVRRSSSGRPAGRRTRRRCGRVSRTTAKACADPWRARTRRRTTARGAVTRLERSTAAATTRPRAWGRRRRCAWPAGSRTGDPVGREPGCDFVYIDDRSRTCTSPWRSRLRFEAHWGRGWTWAPASRSDRRDRAPLARATGLESRARTTRARETESRRACTGRVRIRRRSVEAALGARTTGWRRRTAGTPRSAGS